MPTRRFEVADFVRFTVFVLFLLCLQLPVSVCRADDEVAARAEFDRGVSLFSQEDYPRALEAFRASYKLGPKAAVLYNIANCERALYRYIDSIATFERVLSEWGGTIDEDTRRNAQTNIAEMKSMLGRIILKGAPRGARVLINGEEKAKTPLTGPLLVDPGQHAIQLQKEGYKNLDTTFTVASDSVATVQASMQPVVSMLNVECDEEHAVIRLDGSVLGGCPYSGEIAPGRHLLRVEAPEREPYSKEIAVKNGSEMTLLVKLVSNSSEPATLDASLPDGTSNKANSQKRNGLLTGGIVSVVLGAAATAVGIAFTAKGVRDVQEGDELYQDAETDLGYWNEYNDLYEDNDIPLDNAMVLAGYITGGVLLATGTVLLVLAGPRESEKNTVALRPALGGAVLDVRF